MRADWVDKNPNAAQAITDGRRWRRRSGATSLENKDEMAAILGRRQWFNVPPADILGRLKGDINYGNGRVAKGTGQEMKFWQGRRVLSVQEPRRVVPHREHPLGQASSRRPTSRRLVDKVNREDIWRAAAKAASALADIPASTSRGKETFFDGKVFDPENPSAYLASLAIKRVA